MIRDKSHVATVDHKDIKSWAEARNARPVQIRKFEGERIFNRLKFRFPKDSYPNEEDLDWDTFFDIFDREKMEFVFEDVADDAIEEGNIYQFRARSY